VGRSLAAIVIGYLVFAASAGMLFRVSGQDPRVFPSSMFLVFSVGYGVVFALLAGYLAAAVAGRSEMLHAGTLAGIVAVIALVSMIIERRHGSTWSEWAVLACMVPAALVGGAICRAGRTHGQE
jgi:hypothetical protein